MRRGRRTRLPLWSPLGPDKIPLMTRALIPRRSGPHRSSAAVLKRRWREQQRNWGTGRDIDAMTETQIWYLVRILITLLNIRDGPRPGQATHARALSEKFDWSQGVMMPRLQRLESLGWVRTEWGVREIGGKRCRVQSYRITGAGEAVAVVMEPYLRRLIEIVPQEHRRP